MLLGLLKVLPSVETWSALYTWRAAVDLILGWGLFLAVRRAYADRSPLPLATALLCGLGASLVLGVLSVAEVIDLSGYRPQAAAERMHSVFFLSGWFSEYVVLTAPPAIIALAAIGRWGRRLTLPFAALAVAGLALTLQRGAWFALLAQLAFSSLFIAGPLRERLRRRTGSVVLQTSAALLVMTGVFATTGIPVSEVVERGSEIETGLSPRLVLWRSAAGLAAERPLLGWGLGSFAPAYDLAHPRGSEGASPWRNTAHNLYLGVATERGSLGLLALALVAASAALCLARPRAGEEKMATALAAALVGAVVYGLVQDLFHLRNIAWLLWLLLAAVGSVTRREQARWNVRASQALLLIAALLVPIRALGSKPPPYQGNRAFGFHEIEQDPRGSFRWTESLAAVSVAREDVELGAPAELVLELANGHPQGAARPVNVEVTVDGEIRARLEIAGGWEEHSFEIQPGSQEKVLLTLKVSPTFRPFSDLPTSSEAPASLDIRSLGVAMRGPRWR